MEKKFFTDHRDGKSYKTVKIGEQVWMAQNLCFGEGSENKRYGEDNVARDADHNEITLSDAKIRSYGRKYGLLYTWDNAISACPEGWHLPTKEEWDELLNYAGGVPAACQCLKAKSGWEESGCGTDEFGFSALPGGFGHWDDGFFDIGISGNWWTASTVTDNEDIYPDEAYAYVMHIGYKISWESDYKQDLCSVRCVKD